jgi:hypothetical protein
LEDDARVKLRSLKVLESSFSDLKVIHERSVDEAVSLHNDIREKANQLLEREAALRDLKTKNLRLTDENAMMQTRLTGFADIDENSIKDAERKRVTNEMKVSFMYN